jgi:N-acetylneuraminate synthase
MEIYNRKVGESFPPLIIAEIGINHGGNLEVAKAMVDSAFRCGVEVVKHQTHIVDDEMSSMAKNVKPGNSEKSIYKIMDECSLSESEEYELMEYVKSKGMIFISTPFSRAAADRLNAFGVPAFKIGSGECNNYPLLEHISKFKKPIILSTGMNNIESIKKAVQIFKKYDIQYALLHTTNLYPTPVDLVRLGALKEIMNNFPGIPVGLSDHTTSNLACLSAVALGASILERHFTDSMSRKGPDIICSMDELNCANLIKDSLDVFKMRGGKKEAAIEEAVTINFAFSSVVTIKKIKKDELFTMDNIWVKRPGTGQIRAIDFEKILGKKANKDLENDIQLSWNDIK